MGRDDLNSVRRLVPVKKKVATSKNGSKQYIFKFLWLLLGFVFILIISIFTFLSIGCRGIGSDRPNMGYQRPHYSSLVALEILWMLMQIIHLSGERI